MAFRNAKKDVGNSAIIYNNHDCPFQSFDVTHCRVMIYIFVDLPV
jgi:hypothetical protein